MVKKLSIIDGFSELCKISGKWGVYIAFIGPRKGDDKWLEELFKAAPYLNNDDIQIETDCEGFILCDTEKEMEDICQPPLPINWSGLLLNRNY